MGGLKKMGEQRFLDHVYDGYGAGQRYCFVLGAGASRSSGIRTGEELMREWRQYLSGRGKGYIDECAADLDLTKEEYEPIFEEGYKLKNEDYFTLFDLRFSGQPNAAFAFLEKEMAGKYPSYGYFPLSMILSNTDNRLVITTNFDSLIEDALFTYKLQHPLVVGHESLASYISNDARRPVVAKIHRDLLFRPMNRKEDMKKLADEWERPLSNALTKYIPIIIGYAGGDQSFMSLLEKLELNGMFWCTLGEEPSDKISRIIQKNNGYWVTISGFDEILFRMGERFHEEARFGDPCQYLRDEAEKRCKLYEDSFQRIRDKYAIQKQTAHKSDAEGQETDRADMVSAIESYDARRNTVPQETLTSKALLSQTRVKIAEKKYEDALQLCGRAIAAAPEDAEGYDLRSIVYHRMKNYEKALVYADKALELAPKKAKYYDSRSTTLHEMHRYEEALEDAIKAVELEPDNAKYYWGRGITLHEMERYEEALADKTKAIELSPGDARLYYSRGRTLDKLERYEEALADATKAIELSPDNAQYCNSRGVLLDKMKRYEEALRDKTKAIELDPDNALYYSNRSTTFYHMHRYEEDLKDITRAIELAPDNAKYYESRKFTLNAMGRTEDAKKDEEMAEKLRSGKAE